MEKENNFGIHPRNAEQAFALEILNDPEVKLMGLTGKAGTGKTLLRAGSGAETEPNVSANSIGSSHRVAFNKDLGYLPGDENRRLLLHAAVI